MFGDVITLLAKIAFLGYIPKYVKVVAVRILFANFEPKM